MHRHSSARWLTLPLFAWLSASALAQPPAADQPGELLRIKGHSNLIMCVAFAPDGKRAVSGSHDETVRVWEAETGKEVRSVAQEEGIRGMAVAPDGGRVLLGGADGIVRLWDVESGQELRLLKGHTGEVTGVAFSLDGRRALSAGADQTIRLWALPK